MPPEGTWAIGSARVSRRLKDREARCLPYLPLLRTQVPNPGAAVGGGKLSCTTSSPVPPCGRMGEYSHISLI